MLDAQVTHAELDAAGDEPARVALLADRVWTKVYASYVKERGLTATPDEIAEIVAYHREFERRDRLQRARKLAELNERLADDGLDQGERARLDEFRRVLVRMAERDAARGDAAPDSDGEPESPASWIEFWKTNLALYAQYGGTVALTTAGPTVHGARIALIADYERRGLVRFLDQGLRDRVFEAMSRPPLIVVPPQEVDFTPYWRRPIPSSYFPD